jgi:glucosamine--fructose-6-phosphate aminotransferase (isomerizing)
MDVSFHTTITQQADSLKDLAYHYRHAPPLELLSRTSSILLTGMGASLHAAQLMTYHLHALGIPALCIEATDLLHVGQPLLQTGNTVIFISQSGASAEVKPIVERLPAKSTLLAITNEPDSRLAQRADIVFPLRAGAEEWVATKTYVNSIALGWLLARQIGGVADGNEFETLGSLADACAQLIGQEKQIAQQWLESLRPPAPLLFVGHGPDSVTARHTTMMLSEWSKQSAFSASAGAFRHGFIEQVQPGCAVVGFASHARTYPLMQGLAQELRGYGARVLLVSSGQIRQVEATPEFAFDSFLAPILDIIPAQFFVEALARKLGIPPGFRYISKIVSKL